jgi:PAS domain-containing protein
VTHAFHRPDLMELAAAYEPYSVLVTTADLARPGPQILYTNAPFTRMTGYAVHELMGQTPRILQGPRTDRELLERMKRALRAGEDFIARTVNYKRAAGSCSSRTMPPCGAWSRSSWSVRGTT